MNKRLVVVFAAALSLLAAQPASHAAQTPFSWKPHHFSCTGNINTGFSCSGSVLVTTRGTIFLSYSISGTGWSIDSGGCPNNTTVQGDCGINVRFSGGSTGR